ncbi:MAG: hypothetical protein UV82_C0003G0006 [Candidatus Magasanikbacteria bacterium GW2011_GWD2_43_18]|nr:MAG: hypothetical protein UV18_C0012G0010 [Candidatus Magasanikbacteria bacterium GW2011_GWC2_42_27]KKT04907.1 MAG: hypothetical protein UV82_C0003G0006 [Candidatus Magasanikbacteria bacterium GW2011_GWD2_43_18]KKT25405.1 MAG: hypothetical protein UW10_C0008G0017 [Candidatus Magasanikbacteria bacterium GW2011_GWA2_43_9]HBB37815.1 hypothetical protein [Candidatus Magasanikbacteria bacterium]HCC13841.1 hypothetical protein [Candidatus Magasanikbacteria bacterium]
MKKNFFAKVGHFAVVGALLFNSFGVGFVNAAPPKEGVPVGPFTLFDPSVVTVSETDGPFVYPVEVTYTGSTLESDLIVNISVVSSTANFHFTDITGTDNFGSTSYSVTFPSSTENGNRQPVYLNIIGDDVLLGDTVIVLQDDASTDSFFTLNITEDDTAIISSPTFSTSTFSITEGFYPGIGNNFTTLTNTSDKDLTYTINVEGSATLNIDYGFTIKNGPSFSDATLITTSPATVFIAKGESAGFYMNINNPLYNDGVYEVEEVATFTVVSAVDTSANTNTYTFTENPVSTVTIEDNESRIGFISNGFGLGIDEISSISNNVVTSSYLAKLSNNGDGDAMVVINFAGSTATLGTDFAFIETDPYFRVLGVTPLVIIPAGKSVVVPLYIYNIDGGNKTVMMTIDKVIVGETEVPLTAVTGNKIHTFTVVDNGPAPTNRAPVADTEPITLDAIHVGDTSTPVSFPRTFSDPDLDVLTYSVELSDATIATYEITEPGKELVLTGTKAGTTIVTMMATDPDGKSATTTFSLTVENNVPTVNEAIATQRIDLHVTSSVTIDHETLQNLFSDADADDRIAIRLTDNTDATVVTTTSDIEFNSLELTGLKVGTSTIELTGDDQHGGIVTSTFDVVVTDSTPTDTDNGDGNNGGSASSGGGAARPYNTAPQAAFTSGQEVTIAVNTEVTFDASASTDNENNIQFYFWNFGDGAENTVEVSTITHTYTNVGTYTLSVKVRDIYGAESTAEVTVHVVAGTGNPAAPDTTPETTPETNTTPENQPETTPDNTDVVVIPGTTDNTGTTNNTTVIPGTDTTENTENGTDDTGTVDTSDNTTDGTPSEEEIPEVTTEEEGLPTWIRILFGSGAVVAIAGAGIAINRARRVV